MRNYCDTQSATSRIRDAGPEDAGAIAELLNRAIAESTAVWSDQLTDPASRREWLEARSEKGDPVVVCELDGDIVGFAALSDFRPQNGFRQTREDSVFVTPSAHRFGIGSRLMREVLERARRADVHAVVAAIDATNEASICLHRSIGFREVGRMPQVGQKFGRWLDLVLMQYTF